MTWEIIAGLIIITGCLISLGTILTKLVATLTRLDVTLRNVQRMVDETRSRQFPDSRTYFY